MSRIKLPDIPAELGWEGEWLPDEGKQTRQMLYTTLAMITQHEEEILDELGQVTAQILPTNRVLLTAVTGDQEVVAYMADPHVDGRLVLDDYIPELSGQTESEPE